jgi:hypothetical protein
VKLQVRLSQSVQVFLRPTNIGFNGTMHLFGHGKTAIDVADRRPNKPNNALYAKWV